MAQTLNLQHTFRWIQVGNRICPTHIVHCHQGSPGVTEDNKYLRGDPVPMPDARPDPLGSFVAPEVLRAVTAAARTFGTGMADTAELAAEPETMGDAGDLHLLITARGMGLQH